MTIVKFEGREYEPGEYCKDIDCELYNSGKFDDECGGCAAFMYYEWLKARGFLLLMLGNFCIDCGRWDRLQ